MTLLKSGANINLIDRIGRTVLHIAAFHNMTALVEQLLIRPINQLARDFNNMLAIHVAIEKDNADILEILVFRLSIF